MKKNGSFKLNKWTVLGTALVVVLLAGILAPGAQAGSFHFNSINFSLGSLDMTGDLVGLGNEGGTVTLIGYGTVMAMCENKGGTQAPGRNLIQVVSQASDTFTIDSNGHADINLRAADPQLSDIDPSPTPKSAGCPNGNWSVVALKDSSMTWTSAEIIVKDSSGIVQLDLFFTCSYDASGNFSCEEVQ